MLLAGDTHIPNSARPARCGGPGHAPGIMLQKSACGQSVPCPACSAVSKAAMPPRPEVSAAGPDPTLPAQGPHPACSAASSATVPPCAKPNRCTRGRGQPASPRPRSAARSRRRARSRPSTRRRSPGRACGGAARLTPGALPWFAGEAGAREALRAAAQPAACLPPKRRSTRTAPVPVAGSQRSGGVGECQPLSK